MFPFYNCYQIPQLISKFKRFVVNPQPTLANNCKKKFFHNNKCKYMSIKVETELPICKENGHVFLWSISNPDLF